MKKINTFKNVMISFQTATLYWIWCNTIPNNKVKIAVASIVVAIGIYIAMNDADRHARNRRKERRCNNVD